MSDIAAKLEAAAAFFTKSSFQPAPVPQGPPPGAPMDPSMVGGAPMPPGAPMDPAAIAPPGGMDPQLVAQIEQMISSLTDAVAQGQQQLQQTTQVQDATMQELAALKQQMMEMQAQMKMVDKALSQPAGMPQGEMPMPAQPMPVV